MVRVLANGEIVQDDDPRASRSPSSRINASRSRQSMTGNVQGIPNQQRDPAPGQVNMFTMLNQRLLGFGIPRMNLGQTVIEPIVSVGFLSALIFFGLPGVLVGALLFTVSKWSQDGPPEFISNLLGNRPSTGGRDNSNSQSGGGGNSRTSGSGYRLGSS